MRARVSELTAAQELVRAPLRDAVGLAALAGLCYWLLRQATFYGPDGRHVLKMIGSGLEVHDKHYLYVPLLRAAIAGLAPWSLTRYQAGLALSVVGAAVSVFFAQRTFARLGLARGNANLATLVFATAPALVFFATVVELHTPFLAAVGLSMWAAAVCAERPSIARAALLGAATGAATGLHATGHILLLAAAPLAIWRERLSLRRGVLLGVVAGAAHVVAFLALVGVLLWVGYDIRVGGAANHLISSNPARLSVASIPKQVWLDWLLPFAPVSVAAGLAACVAGSVGALFLLALAAYLGVTFVLSRSLGCRGSQWAACWWLPSRWVADG
jgi:hypothetical protein